MPKKQVAVAAFSHKGDLYDLWEDDNGLKFFFKSDRTIPMIPTPKVRWDGGKIPWSVWVNICAFFELTQEKEKSEAQVQLFYHPTEKTWCAHAFPQEANSGMTTKELTEHADYNSQMHAIRSRGFYKYGTIHHHCSANAFQSGTDKHDENEIEGLHITLGKIQPKEPYDIHARFTVKLPGKEISEDEMLPPQYATHEVFWEQFIELPQGYIGEFLPESLRELILPKILLRPDVSGADKQTIDAWMANRIASVKYTGYHKNTGRTTTVYGPNGVIHRHHALEEGGIGSAGRSFPLYSNGRYEGGEAFARFQEEADERSFKDMHEGLSVREAEARKQALINLLREALVNLCLTSYEMEGMFAHGKEPKDARYLYGTSIKELSHANVTFNEFVLYIENEMCDYIDKKLKSINHHSTSALEIVHLLSVPNHWLDVDKTVMERRSSGVRFIHSGARSKSERKEQAKKRKQLQAANS